MDEPPVAGCGFDDDWAESYARFDAYLRTGEYLDAVIEMKAFRDAVSARFAEG